MYNKGSEGILQPIDTTKLLVALAIILLAEIKRHILVLDHVFDLSSHGDGKEDTKVH